MGAFSRALEPRNSRNFQPALLAWNSWGHFKRSLPTYLGTRRGTLTGTLSVSCYEQNPSLCYNYGAGVDYRTLAHLVSGSSIFPHFWAVDFYLIVFVAQGTYEATYT